MKCQPCLVTFEVMISFSPKKEGNLPVLMIEVKQRKREQSADQILDVFGNTPQQKTISDPTEACFFPLLVSLHQRWMSSHIFTEVTAITPLCIQKPVNSLSVSESGLRKMGAIFVSDCATESLCCKQRELVLFSVIFLFPARSCWAPSVFILQISCWTLNILHNSAALWAAALIIHTTCCFYLCTVLLLDEEWNLVFPNTSKSPGYTSTLALFYQRSSWVFTVKYVVFLTVDFLYALQVVQRQLEVVRVHVLVERRHDGAGIVGVLQTQGVAKLMDRHQEQIITWTDGGEEATWLRFLCAEKSQLWDQLLLVGNKEAAQQKQPKMMSWIHSKVWLYCSALQSNISPKRTHWLFKYIIIERMNYSELQLMKRQTCWIWRRETSLYMM